MSESDILRKHRLECMRLAADCRQLAADIARPDLQSHFLRLAGMWTNLASQEANAETATDIN
jgi:hypothetical protein